MRKAVPRLAPLIVLAALAWGCAETRQEVLLKPDVPGPVLGTAESYQNYIEGYLRELNGNLRGASRIYAQALERDPESPHLLTRLASNKYHSGKQIREHTKESSEMDI